MHVVDTAWAAYRLVFANLGALLQVAVGWAVITALPGIAAIVALPVKHPDDENITLVELAPGLLTLILSAAAFRCRRLPQALRPRACPRPGP